MEISSLELNGAFCISGHPDHFPLQSPDMCKYTIFNLECGHPAEDHVESRDCPHYQRNGFPCDRENPANRDRVTVRSEGRKGLCRICQRKEQEKAELDAMQRETKKAREVSLAEAHEREQAAKEHEERIIRESTKEYERLLREREKADMEAALRASQDAHEKRRQQEARDLENALKASRELPPPERNVTIEESVS
jgi:enabled protein